MKKLAIILDSLCGRNKEEIEKHEDYYFLPLKIYLDGKEYRDDDQLLKIELLELINKASDVKTSQPTPGEMEALFTKLSNEYENVIYIPVSSALSGTFQTASIMSKEYNNVHIINGWLTGKQYMVIAEWLKTNETKPIGELVDFARKYGEENITMIIPKDNKAFIRSGRLGKTMAFVLQKAHAVPVIGFESTEKLKKKMIKRSGKNAIKYAIEKISDAIKNVSFKFEWQIVHTLDEEFSNMAIKMLRELGFKDIHKELTNPFVNAHVGDGAFSIGITKLI